ncbi:MAG: hypothetical protein JXO22_17570 [Phycisphaerae bacterium]|nr:hypothetical protein [Phycisphaerae bacterium]
MTGKRALSFGLAMFAAALVCTSLAMAVEETTVTYDPNCVTSDPNCTSDPNDYWDPNCEDSWDPNDPNCWWNPNDPNSCSDPNYVYDPNEYWDPNDPNSFYENLLYGGLLSGYCPFTSTLLITVCIAGMFWSGARGRRL